MASVAGYKIVGETTRNKVQRFKAILEQISVHFVGGEKDSCASLFTGSR